MEFNQTEIQEIKSRLRQGENIDHLVELLNYIINLQNEKQKTKYKLIEPKQAKFIYANINKSYHSFEIPKKTGGSRNISAPSKSLRKIQRRINLILSLLFTPKEAAHGFVNKRSIVTNATIHVGKKFILNVDLKDFFPTVHFGRVKGVLQTHPFSLSQPLAHIVANFCCYQSKLPQGSPASPIITNIVCQVLDAKLVKLAQATHSYFTRYADDITFSCDKNRFNDEFKLVLDKIVQSEGFTINEKKSRIQNKTVRQEVTGVIVNKKLNLTRDYIKKIRAILHNWEKYGYTEAERKFAKFYPKEKAYVRNQRIPSMQEVVHGKIVFLGMVRGKEDSMYLKYLKQFDELINPPN